MPSFEMQPNEQLDLPIVGEYLYIERGEVQVTIHPTDQTYDLQERDKIKVEHYDRITIISRSDEVQTVSFRAGLGDFIPAGQGKEVAIVGGISIREPVALMEGSRVVTMSPSRFNDLKDVELQAGQKLKIANGSDYRQQLIVQNDSADMTLCRVGGSGVEVGRGMRLYGGDGQVGTLILNTSAEVWAVNESDTPAMLSVAELVE